VLKSGPAPTIRRQGDLESGPAPILLQGDLGVGQSEPYEPGELM
jgi:hypothetical protein